MSTNENESVTEGTDKFAVGEEAIQRLVLPTAAIVLSILYVNSVHGRISMSNLRYPYAVIGVLVVLTLGVYLQEVRAIWRIRRNEDRPPFVDSITDRVHKWRKSIALAIFGFIYLWLVEFLGFFVSSALLIASLMVVAGERDYRRVILITVTVLVVIQLFINFLNLSPPEGLFL